MRTPRALAPFLLAVASLALFACGSADLAHDTLDSGSVPTETGTSASGLGAACDPTFPDDPGGAMIGTDLDIDPASASCSTGLCLAHYFQGRGDCPYGNGNAFFQTGTCSEVPGRSQLYTLDGTAKGELCCRRPGTNQPIQHPVGAQCSGRPAKDAEYCSCRCDVPDDPEIDRSKITLCKCGEGYVCKRLCDATTGSCGIQPKSLWGSYCVKDGPLGAGFNPDTDFDKTCGEPLKP